MDTGCWTFHSIGTNFPSSQQKPAHAKCSQLSYVVKIPLLRPLLLHHWPAPSLSIFATSSYTDAAFEKYLLNIEEWKRLYFKTRGQPTTDKRDKTFLLAGWEHGGAAVGRPCHGLRGGRLDGRGADRRAQAGLQRVRRGRRWLDQHWRAGICHEGDGNESHGGRTPRPHKRSTQMLQLSPCDTLALISVRHGRFRPDWVPRVLQHDGG